MPYEINSEKATSERVAHGSICDISMELMNRLTLHEHGHDGEKEELSWLCAAIEKKYNAGKKSNIDDLPFILATKAMEFDDSKLLLCAAIIAGSLHLSAYRMKKLLDGLEE